MRKQYRQKLRELERRAERDVDALIKVLRELATIPAELEQASGDNVRLMERANEDVLRVSIGRRMGRPLGRKVWRKLRSRAAKARERSSKRPCAQMRWSRAPVLERDQFHWTFPGPIGRGWSCGRR